MPAAAAGIAAWFAAGGAGAVFAANALISIGSSLVIGKLNRPKGTGARGTELQISGDPLDVRAICYGEAWTGGTLRYRNSAGTDNRDFYMVIVLAGHEINSVEATEADRNLLTLDGSGNVTAPSQYVGLMNVRFVLGTDSQTVDSTLDSTFANWTSDHRLRGCAYAIVKLTFDETNMPQPPAFRFKVKGRKVYDPRLDSTNGGAGAHRLATPSTWEWSRNPVLQANDFLRGISINSIYIAGLALASTRFDWANVIAEANICDENVSLAVGGTEDRYTGDGFIDPRQTPDEILRHFEMAIAGEIIPSDGKWRFFAGAYRTPTLALTDEHFVGPLRHIVHKGELDKVDTATGRYAALAESGTVVNYSPVRLSTATTGSERGAEFDFQLVADTTNTGGVYDGGARAQRIAKLLLEKEEAGKQIICQTNLYGLRAVPGETITITHAAFGLSAQAMRVMEVQLRPVPTDSGVGLVVDLVLEAGPSSLYSWSAAESALSPAPTLPQLNIAGQRFAIGWMADSEGKPAGVRAAEGITDRSQVSISGSAMKIAGSSDASVGYCLPAIPVDPSKVYRLTIKHRSSIAVGDGLYIYFFEYNSALPAGKTHVVNSSGDLDAGVAASQVTGLSPTRSDVAMPGTTSIVETFTYTPNASADYASLSFANWNASSAVDYFVEWVDLTVVGEPGHIDLLPSVRSPADTQDLNLEAATSVYTEVNASELSIPLAGVTVVSKENVTEPADCTVFATLTFDVDSNGDSGGLLEFYAEISGVGTFPLDPNPNYVLTSTTFERLTFQAQFDVSAGQTWDIFFDANSNGSAIVDILDTRLEINVMRR